MAGNGKKFLIAIIIVVILAIIIGLIIYFVKYKSSNIPIPNPASRTINYGDIIQLVNQWGNKHALSTCSLNYGCTTYNATLSVTSTDPTTSQWQFYSLTKSNGTPVLYGDNIKIKNQSTGKKDLGACGTTTDGCGVNVGVGRITPDLPSESWIIGGKTKGMSVKTGDIVTLQSNFNNLLLSSCGYYNAGYNCGVNASLRTDMKSLDTSQQWQIVCVSDNCGN